MEKSLELLKNLGIKESDYIVVACSGGPDSMCLLDLLYKNNYKIVCAHVNHNIRKESAQEYEILESFCKKNNIIFEGYSLEKEENKNEAYYRKKRHDFYKRIADKYKTRYIATAHHGDDLIETILMRITRGSNLKGYIGFTSVFNEKGYIMIKPLIFYTKDDIITYNKKNNIAYFIDKTNNDDKYTRNRYRHKVLPFLKSENKNIHRKYIKFSEELSKASRFINSIVKKEMENNYLNNIIDLNKFQVLDEYIKESELIQIFSNIYKDDIDKINSKHINHILDLLKKNKNFTYNLPKDIIIKREYDKLSIEEKKVPCTYNKKLEEYNELESGYIIKKVSETSDTSNNTIRINSSDIDMPLYIRNKKDGDVIEVKNLNGHKKINKIFIDEKVSPSKRTSWPIVVDKSDKVIWIPGLKKSKFDNEKLQKYDIILKYERKEESNEKQC